MNPLVSIVMTAHNRKPQLMFTLRTINNSVYKNVEIIAVDDSSNEENRFDQEQYRTSDENALFNSLNIKVFRIESSQKSWINPCMAYNMGFKEATGDIIIIQNAEVCHIGDCIKYVVDNLQKGDWLSLNCYGLGSFDQNKQLETVYNTNNLESCFKIINHYIQQKPYKLIGGNTINSNDPQGWLNHCDIFFTAYHYFGAIYKCDLLEKMGGGFHEGYKNGLCLDDIDFVKYLVHNKFRFTTCKFTSNNPFVVHQYHSKYSELASANKHVLYNINKNIFKQRIAQIGSTESLDPGAFMPPPVFIS